MELWKKIETRSTSMEPEDDGGWESKERTVAWYIIEDEDSEKFSEHIADECSYQDYDLQINYKKILVTDLEEIKQLGAIIDRYLVAESLGGDSPDL